ncbi:MAG: hypothetical protein M3253_05205, partial [Chloroflexota bacterium]|nr:hypothetical protein [Chloroflexota bacterium]
AACIADTSDPRPQLDLSRYPHTVLFSDQFEVGDPFTLGMTGPPEDATRPVRITSVRVVALSGMELIGIGAFDPEEVGSGIGAVPGWPPIGYDIRALDDQTHSVDWPAAVYTVVGVRITEPQGGLRGVVVDWIDGDGVSGSEIFDIAALNCAPGACDEPGASDHSRLLNQLGLTQ